MFPALLFALGLLSQAPQATEVRPLTLYTFVTLPSGEKRPISGVTFENWHKQTQVWHFTAKPTPCNTSSAARLEDPRAEGWEVSVGPSDRGEGPRIVWKRLHSDAGSARVLPVRSFGSWALDEVPIPPSSRGECEATAWSMEAKFGSPWMSSELIEAELWFVHKTPDGRETSQRQAIRIKEGRPGDFYFDDLPLNLKPDGVNLPIVVEVFGSVIASGRLNGGFTKLTLNLTRRYIAKGVAFGVWPKVGSTEYPLTVTPGEVVSFVLPPLSDDNGILLGHRFSVRLRIKPVGDGEN